MIERFDRFGRMMSLRQLMDRLLEDAFVIPSQDQERTLASPNICVYEEGDYLIVEADLPGMRPEDVDVSVDRGMLTIRGEINADEERKERTYLVHEHRHGSFMRSVRLPDSVNVDAVDASFENGVLRLRFPKSEQAKARRIPITGDGRQALPTERQTGAGGQGSEQSAARQPVASGASSDGGVRS